MQSSPERLARLLHHGDGHERSELRRVFSCKGKVSPRPLNRNSSIDSLAKRYIVPIIAPPTPPQLEQDKASIDESFDRAFSLIDQLTTDTAAIKTSEAARTEKLDAALAEMDAAVSEMKLSTRRRDDDSRRINDEIRNLQALVPRAMKAQEENTDARLRELNTELKSLKTLISNRMSGQGVPQARVPRGASPAVTAAGAYAAPAVTNANGSVESAAPPPASSVADAATQPDRSNSASPFNRFGSKGGIPAWQLAAAKKTEEEKAGVEAGKPDADAASSIVS